jgi:hypothetical protein
MAEIRVGNEKITVKTNSAGQEAGLKALCDGFNAQQQMRKEAKMLMIQIRRQVRIIEQAYNAVIKPKDDLPAEITALSMLTSSLEELLEGLREHAVRVACSKNLEDSFIADPKNLTDFLEKVERNATKELFDKFGLRNPLEN